MSLLEVKNARFCYDEREIFRDIEFSVEPGRIYCIFGPNGCGKSTLLECILGLLPLKEGQIRLNGSPIESLNPKELAKKIAYVPQIHEKSFPYTVQEFVLMGRTAHGNMLTSPGQKDLPIVEEALESLGMIDYKDRPYTQLSGGELQLVMLARAIVQQTPVIVMDEPTSHLDFKNDLIILETISRLVTEKKLSIVMATHSPNHGFYFEYHELPVEVLLMGERGKLIRGKPSEVFTEDTMRRVFEMESRVIACQTGENRVLRQIVPIRSALLK